MGDTWITDLTDFLNEDGTILPSSGAARRLVDYMVSIVSVASTPFSLTQKPSIVRCRRRPNRKPCRGEIGIDLDPETEEVVWWCPVCGDNGCIKNWKGSLWDFRGANKLHEH